MKLCLDTLAYLLRAAINKRGILLLVLGKTAVAAALGSRPALDLELLLGLHREGESLGAAVAVHEQWAHALVCGGAVVAALGLLPTLLLKDTRLGIREEEGGLALTAGQVAAYRLLALLCVTAVGTAGWLRPALLLEEHLVLACEREARATIDTGQLDVLRQRITVALGLLVTFVTACRLLALVLVLLERGLAVCDGLRLLLRNLLLQLGDALRGTRKKLTQLLSVLTDGKAVEAVVAVRLGLDEHLTIDKRHFC